MIFSKFLNLNEHEIHEKPASQTRRFVHSEGVRWYHRVLFKKVHMIVIDYGIIDHELCFDFSATPRMSGYDSTEQKIVGLIYPNGFKWAFNFDNNVYVGEIRIHEGKREFSCYVSGHQSFEWFESWVQAGNSVGLYNECHRKFGLKFSHPQHIILQKIYHLLPNFSGDEEIRQLLQKHLDKNQATGYHKTCCCAHEATPTTKKRSASNYSKQRPAVKRVKKTSAASSSSTMKQDETSLHYLEDLNHLEDTPSSLDQDTCDLFLDQDPQYSVLDRDLHNFDFNNEFNASIDKTGYQTPFTEICTVYGAYTFRNDKKLSVEESETEQLYTIVDTVFPKEKYDFPSFDDEMYRDFQMSLDESIFN